MRPTDQIKEKIDILDFIKEYVELKPAGRSHKGLCPFHKEKSPSFVVTPDRNIWHCFGCGVGGDIFGFLMQYENIEFIEALKILADKAGVELKKYGSADEKRYQDLYDITRIAKEFYVKTIGEPMGAPALKYLKERGLTRETIETFEIGLAGPNNDAITQHLLKLGYNIKDIERAGIAHKTKRGTYWDRFRNRIMFPLYNHFGKVIGFTGRVLPGEESERVGKYVNSPETPIYNKSKVLYGFDKTKKAIRDASTAVLVEGQMDCIMAYQDGIQNVVASSGTAITSDHVHALRKVAENLILIFDNDKAGKMAAVRTIDSAQKEDFNVLVAMLGKSAKDPADLVQASPGALQEKINAAIPAMEYYFALYHVAKDLPIATKKKGVRKVLGKIKSIQSPIERAYWIKKLSSVAEIPEDVLQEEMSAIKGNKEIRKEKKEEKEKRQESRVDIITQRLFALAIQEADLKKEIEKRIDMLPKRYAPVATYLLEGGSEEPPSDIAGIVNLIHLRAGFAYSESDPKEEFDALCKELEKEKQLHKKKVLQLKIRKAEEKGDAKELEKLLAEYHILTRT